jgi:hypothetical protein
MFERALKNKFFPFPLLFILFLNADLAYGGFTLQKPKPENKWIHFKLIEDVKKIVVESFFIDKDQQLSIDFKKRPHPKRVDYNFDDTSIEEKNIQINIKFSF